MIFLRSKEIVLLSVILLIYSHRSDCFLSTQNAFRTVTKTTKTSSNINTQFRTSSLSSPLISTSHQKQRTFRNQRTFRRPDVLHLSDESLSEQPSSNLKSNNIGVSTYLTVFGILPVVSFFLFDQLLAQITDFDSAPSDRQLWIIALLLSKRLYIYAVALTTVDLAAKRSVDLPASLGQRLFTINGEIFDGIPLLDLNTNTDSTPAAIAIKQENKEIYAALDTIDDSTQAKLIPILVAGSLLVSFLLLGVTSSINQAENIIINTDTNLLQNLLLEIQKSLGPYFLQFISSITLFWNAAVCSLFSKAEIQAAFSNFTSSIKENSSNEKIMESLAKNRVILPFILSLMISVVSFFSLPGSDAWPIQNILNICIAITVARAAQLPRLPYIVLALIGLVFYDVISVVGTQQFTDGGASIMEAVARAKAGIDTLPPLPPLPIPSPSLALPPLSSLPPISTLSSIPMPSISTISSISSVPIDTVNAVVSTATDALSRVPFDSSILPSSLSSIPPPSAELLATPLPPLPPISSLPPSSLPLSSIPVSLPPTPPRPPALIPSLSSWRPGLFQVVVGRKVSDVLGLADVVFPAMLAGWGLRYDLAKKLLYETEIENSRQIIESNLRVIDDQYDENIENTTPKKTLFQRIRNIFSTKKSIDANNEKENNRKEKEQEISKEREREQNIIAILEDEKIEEFYKKLNGNLKNSVFSSTLLGYGFGCFLCELFQTGEGQPALLYIVPSMFVSVFLSGVVRGDLNDMWGYNPEPDNKEGADDENNAMI